MYLTNIELIAPPSIVVGLAPILALNAVSALNGLDVTNVVNGFVVGVTVADQNIEWWKIRARAVSGEDTDNLVFIVPTGDATRVWRRVG